MTGEITELSTEELAQRFSREVIVPPTYLKGMPVLAAIKDYTKDGEELHCWEVVVLDVKGTYGEPGRFIVYEVMWNGAGYIMREGANDIDDYEMAVRVMIARLRIQT